MPKPKPITDTRRAQIDWENAPIATENKAEILSAYKAVEKDLDTIIDAFSRNVDKDWIAEQYQIKRTVLMGYVRKAKKKRATLRAKQTRERNKAKANSASTKTTTDDHWSQDTVASNGKYMATAPFPRPQKVVEAEIVE